MKTWRTCVGLLLVGVASTAEAQLTLNGTVRDFTPGTLDVATGSNPDFERCITGVVPGLVQSQLTGSAPTLTNPASGNGCIESAASFAAWWGAGAPSVAYSLTLNETAPGSGIFGFSSNSFFPINGQLLGNYGGTGQNFHFTYQISATFGYVPGAGQTFSFTGDDDVWVFFDKLLGIDLGGVHGATGATVNLDDLFGPGKAAGNYSFDFFFAERHTSESNLTIQTSLNLTPLATPEPATVALLATGLVGLLVVRRRRVP